MNLVATIAPAPLSSWETAESLGLDVLHSGMEISKSAKIFQELPFE